MSNGLFIVLEGIDGSGTTTQVRRLVQWLDAQGHAAVATGEPTGQRVGRLIRKILGDRLIDRETQQPLAVDEDTMGLLFAADRADHLRRTVLPALDAGHVVVSDRHYLSSVAYQSLGTDMATVESLNAGFRRPDLTVMLDIDPAVSLERKQGDAERYERTELLRRVRDNYRRACAHAAAAGERIEWLDAERPVEEVERDIRRLVAPLLADRHEGNPPPPSPSRWSDA